LFRPFPFHALISNFIFFFLFLYPRWGTHKILFFFFLSLFFQFPSSAGGDEIMDSGGAGRVVSIYQSTCHRALTHCQSDLQCRKHLDPFLRYCNGGGGGASGGSTADTCHRDLCMQALQGFYKDAPLQWSLEVAFCVCK
jgi:hypothetical protein